MTIESFEGLPPEWDEEFLPRMSRRVKLKPAVDQCFVTHFCRRNLPRFFSSEALPEIHENLTLQHILENCLALDSNQVDSHKKSRQFYLKAFREHGVTIGKKKGAARDLLKWLLIEWKDYCRKREIKISSAAPQQVLTDLLASLDYKQQKRVFEDVQTYCLDQQQWASAFVLRADPDLQHWLVHSLLQSVDGMLNATIIPTTGKQLFKGFDPFWGSVASALGLEGQVSKEVVIETLYDRIQTQAIVMVVNQVDQAKRVLPIFRDEFWIPLVNRLNEHNGLSAPRGGFKLLMISPIEATVFSDHDWVIHSTKEGLPEEVSEDFLQCPIELAALTQIRCPDVRTWIKRAGVQEFMCQRLESSWEDAAVVACCQKIESMPDNDSDPYTVLHDICCAFNFEDGLDALESYWKTSSVGVAA